MGEMKDREDGAPWRNFYGRRHGKTLRRAQEDLLRDRLPELAPKGVAWAENPGRDPVDFAAFSPTGSPEATSGAPAIAKEIWLEIGFGGGEHLIAMAAANPDVVLVGCEPFVNGVAMCLSAHEDAGLTNVRLHAGDAREVFDVAAEGVFSRVFVNYPDPWPKSRHHKRRFVSPANLAHLARVTRRGGRLHIASDIPDYIRHSLEAMRSALGFRWTAERPQDWRAPWSDWPGTRYEAKALREGRTPCYLTFERT